MTNHTHFANQKACFDDCRDVILGNSLVAPAQANPVKREIHRWLAVKSTASLLRKLMI